MGYGYIPYMGIYKQEYRSPVYEDNRLASQDDGEASLDCISQRYFFFGTCDFIAAIFFWCNKQQTLKFSNDRFNLIHPAAFNIDIF